MQSLPKISLLSRRVTRVWIVILLVGLLQPLAAHVVKQLYGEFHDSGETWELEILFVLGIFLLQRRWKPLLSQSLAFTAAHTITLGLAAAGHVSVPGKIVEPLIALSITALAVENLFIREAKPWRLWLVFAFGLVHGLGFAGVLSTWIRPGEGFFVTLVSA
ncbi:MAG: hypothetical protein EOP83_07230, partial [Verrucomicrobiaceae bacterium]